MVDLKSIRKEKGYTQQRLADEAGLRTHTAIWMIEKGINKPSVQLAKKLGEILDFDWTLFFSEEMSVKRTNAVERT